MAAAMLKKNFEISDIMRPSAIRPVFRRIGVEEVSRAGSIARHQHTGYEVIFVDKGLYACLHNNVRVELGENGLLIVKPCDWHTDLFADRFLRYLAIGFDLQVAPGLPVSIFRDGTPVERQHFLVRRNDFLPLFDRISHESRIADFVSAHILDAIVLEFFYHMIRATPGAILSDCFVATSDEASFNARLFSAIHARLNMRLSVEELAADLDMSESSLAHKCRKQLGISPARLFMRIKMDRAVQMLQSTDMSVKEVSSYLGFEDSFHFSRTFKNMFGKVPSVMKKTTTDQPVIRIGSG